MYDVRRLAPQKSTLTSLSQVVSVTGQKGSIPAQPSFSFYHPFEYSLEWRGFETLPTDVSSHLDIHSWIGLRDRRLILTLEASWPKYYHNEIEICFAWLARVRNPPTRFFSLGIHLAIHSWMLSSQAYFSQAVIITNLKYVSLALEIHLN
jgi:hypothetical protein